MQINKNVTKTALESLGYRKLDLDFGGWYKSTFHTFRKSVILHPETDLVCLWKLNGLVNNIGYGLATLKEYLIRCDALDKIRSVVVSRPGCPADIKDLADFKNLELVFVVIGKYGWEAKEDEQFYFKVIGPEIYAVGLGAWENLDRDLVSIEEYQRLIQGVIARGQEKVVPKVVFVDMFSKVVVREDRKEWWA